MNVAENKILLILLIKSWFFAMLVKQVFLPVFKREIFDNFVVTSIVGGQSSQS
jgi:hypothetical protein